MTKVRLSKGQKTREAIITRALARSSAVGLDGLTMGVLADDIGLSKGGLFAHFTCKEDLQRAVLGRAAEIFIRRVVSPALKAPRGETRVRALFEKWMQWAGAPGGGFFVGLAAEYDDKPGAVRDLLVQTQHAWMDVIRRVVRTAKDQGDFRKDLDEDQFAFGIYAVMLAGHHFNRLMKDTGWRTRSRAAFDLLLESARVARKTTKR